MKISLKKYFSRLILIEMPPRNINIAWECKKSQLRDPPTRPLLPHPPRSIQVCVHTITEHLHLAGDDIQGVVRRVPIHRLAQAIPEAVIGEGVAVP